MVCEATTTSGLVLEMASITFSTSTDRAMFIPQWQTKTPIRGSSSRHVVLRRDSSSS